MTGIFAMNAFTGRFAAGLAALMLVALPAMAETGIKTAETGLGPVLTDAAGMTLYIFDADKDGMSSCYDACATNWPPLLAAADAAAEGDYGLTDRTDGTKQWTYKGMPLYTWIKDTAPGETTGDGVKDVWHAAKP